MSWKIYLINAEISKKIKNNWNDDDDCDNNNINNEKDFCFSFIESFENSYNLSFEVDKIIFLSLKKIN